MLFLEIALGFSADKLALLDSIGLDSTRSLSLSNSAISSSSFFSLPRTCLINSSAALFLASFFFVPNPVTLNPA